MASVRQFMGGVAPCRQGAGGASIALHLLRTGLIQRAGVAGTTAPNAGSGRCAGATVE